MFYWVTLACYLHLTFPFSLQLHIFQWDVLKSPSIAKHSILSMCWYVSRHYFWNPMYCPLPMSFRPWAGLSWGWERKRVCLHRPFCLPAEVTSRKVIRASGTCYCYTGQFWFWAEKCLGKTEDVVAFVLFSPSEHAKASPQHMLASFAQIQLYVNVWNSVS